MGITIVRRRHMSESISELVALLVGLVVLYFLWQSLGASEQAGRGRRRQLRNGHALRSGVNHSPRG